MSFSYNPEEISPSGTNLISAVRFLIADVNASNPQIQDEEITALAGDVTATDATFKTYTVAISAAEYIYRKYLQMVTFSSAGTSVNYSDLAKQYQEILNKLTAQKNTYAGNNMVIYAYRAKSYSC